MRTEAEPMEQQGPIYLRGVDGDWMDERVCAELVPVVDRFLDEVRAAHLLGSDEATIEAAAGDALAEAFSRGARCAAVELLAQLIEAGVDAYVGVGSGEL